MIGDSDAEVKRNNDSTPLLLETSPTGLRLSLLWTSLMFLYIYNDYFSLYVSGTIESISAGRMGPLGPATDTILIVAAVVLAIPAIMIFLSTALPRGYSKWTNVVLGAVYTVVEVLTFLGSEPFYKLIVVLEIVLTVLIIWYALRWPGKQHVA